MKDLSEITKYYDIHPDGRCYSKRNKTWMKPVRGWYNQLLYCLRTDKRVTVSLPNVVASVYVPNPKGFKDVVHIDHNRFNNNADNLKWVSKADVVRSGRTLRNWSELDVMSDGLTNMLSNDGRKREVVIDGIVYQSVKEACLDLGVSRRTFNRKGLGLMDSLINK